RRLRDAARKARPAQIQWRRVSWVEWHCDQEPRRHRRGRLRLRHRPRLRHGTLRVACQDHTDARRAARERNSGAARRRSNFVTVMRSVVLGCGSYLPSRVLTNAELANKVATSDEWITQRTGIRQRHIAANGEVTSDLAIHAARAALTQAKV